MKREDFASIKACLIAMDKRNIPDSDSEERWYRCMRPYTYEDIRNALDANARYGKMRPTMKEVFSKVPHAQYSGEKFDPGKSFVNVNGQLVKTYQCKRCHDSGMYLVEDENDYQYGIPCDCPAGHTFFHWGWLTEEQQKQYVEKHGSHGEVIGEIWGET